MEKQTQFPFLGRSPAKWNLLRHATCCQLRAPPSQDQETRASSQYIFFTSAHSGNNGHAHPHHQRQRQLQPQHKSLAWPRSWYCGWGKMNLSKLFEWHFGPEEDPKTLLLLRMPCCCCCCCCWWWRRNSWQPKPMEAAQEMRQSKQMAAATELLLRGGSCGRQPCCGSRSWLLFHSGIPHSHPGATAASGNGNSNGYGSCLNADAWNGKKWHLRKAKREK